MANVFCKNGWPMLLEYAEANALNTSEAHNGGGLGRPHLGNSLCAPLVLKALASAYLKSIGHPFCFKH